MTGFKLRDASGIPFALAGQIVLGGDAVAKDRLGNMEGRLLPCCLDGGTSIFKRIGKATPTDSRAGAADQKLEPHPAAKQVKLDTSIVACAFEFGNPFDNILNIAGST
jgi:hypothetical protein